MRRFSAALLAAVSIPVMFRDCLPAKNRLPVMFRLK